MFNAATTATHSALVPKRKAVGPGPFELATLASSVLLVFSLSRNGTMTLNAFITMVIYVNLKKKEIFVKISVNRNGRKLNVSRRKAKNLKSPSHLDPLCIKTKSIQALLPLKGQIAKHATVKWLLTLKMITCFY